MDTSRPRETQLANGLLAAAILWGLVLIGLLAGPSPKPHELRAGPAACSQIP